MSHITFYRKYRSKDFEEIVGQPHIVQTLNNAIIHDRLSHAYIFSGPRGTGKTSSARILAKSLNCRSGKTPSPCGTCDLCQKIAHGSSVDVIEIDAASNTGVDNIRTLNDQVNFAPVECRYKIYIIDEAHMLSTGAFNALLKTLEEPPAQTLFILATTEPHKLPVTIHSRCQHLQFRSMATPELVAQLRHIATQEKIAIDDACLKTIARNAGGSMRDAVSLLDQLYSFKGQLISFEDVMLILGAVNIDHLVAVIDACLKQDVKAVITQLDTLTNLGCNITQLTQDLILVIKDIMLIKLNLDSHVDGDQSYIDHIKTTLIHPISFEQLNILLETLAKTELDLRWFPRQELLLQVRLLSVLHHTPPNATPAQSTPPSKVAPPVSAPSSPPQPPRTTPSPFASPAKPNTELLKNTPVQSSQKEQTDVGLWATVLDKIKVQKPSVYSILKESRVLSKTSDTLTIALKEDFKFFREKLKESANKDCIQTTIKDVFGVSLTFQLSSPSDASTPQPSPPPSPHTSSSPSSPQSVSMTPPKPPSKEAMKINQLIQMFDGTLVH